MPVSKCASAAEHRLTCVVSSQPDVDTQDAQDNSSLSSRPYGFPVWIQVESAGSLCWVLLVNVALAQQVYQLAVSTGDTCCSLSTYVSLVLKCRARLCGSATDCEVPTGISQTGPLPHEALAYTGECHAGLWRQSRSASCGDSQHSSMRCPVPSFARECMLTDLVQLFYLLQASSLTARSVQVTLLPTASDFLPNIRTFLERWQPNVAILMVRACIDCFSCSPASHTSPPPLTTGLDCLVCLTSSHLRPAQSNISDVAAATQHCADLSVAQHHNQSASPLSLRCGLPELSTPAVHPLHSKAARCPF